MTDHAEVTAAQIARLAGVGRAAVSNWRRRHPSFPAPVGGSESSPTFSLAAVEQWLRAEGKLGEIPAEELLWRAVDGAGGHGGSTGSTGGTGASDGAGGTGASDGAGGTSASDGAGAPSATTAAVLGAIGAAFSGADHGGTVTPDVLGQATDLADKLGPSTVFEDLLGRYLDSHARDLDTGTATPALAALMAALALPAADRSADPGPVTVYDPSCGAGSLLAAAARALDGSPAAFLGETSESALAPLAATRLALLSPGAVVDVRDDDALLADAFQDRAADAVLTQPPANQRAWGLDELAYDPRWEYGMPPRGEPELAWIQHALARLRPGGTAVLLLPPSVAARRAGRRVRAELLRRGALRAVVGLPAGAAAPQGPPMHLWILRRPDYTAPTPGRVLFVDESDAGRDGGVAPSARTSERITRAWQAFDADPDTFGATAGLTAAPLVIELLDEAVDMSPARHVPRPETGLGRAHLAESRASVHSVLAQLGALLPELGPEREPNAGPPWPMTTLGDLARGGALAFVAEAPIEAGDVVVPLFGGSIGQADVVGGPGDALAGTLPTRGVAVLRTDPAQLEAWFVAGFLRSDTAARHAVSHASTVSRMDIRKAPLPRLPLERQRAYTEAFRQVAEFRDALRLAGELGERLAHGVTDALAEGTVLPRT